MMKRKPVSTEGEPGYSADDYALAEKISVFIDKFKQLLMNKKMIPVEAELIVKALNFLKTLPVPQLKIICLVIGILIAVYCIIRMAVVQ